MDNTRNPRQESIITVYQGKDPNEFERIKTTLDSQGITFYKSIYLGLRIPLDPLDPASDRIKIALTPWRFRSERLKKLISNELTGFQIKILQKDEFTARRLLRKLELSRELCKENPSIYDKLSNAFNKIALPLAAYCTLIAMPILIYIYLKIYK